MGENDGFAKSTKPTVPQRQVFEAGKRQSTTLKIIPRAMAFLGFFPSIGRHGP